MTRGVTTPAASAVAARGGSGASDDGTRQLGAHLSDRRRRHLQVWLVSGALIVAGIVAVGGITRLTQSGLSIVEWQPLIGVVPPLTEAQWLAAFEGYRQFPEYQQLRRGMTLAEFRFIYFWEYLHRLLARLVGLVFLIPFLVFWARGYLDRPLGLRFASLFALGAFQGFLGWYMVMSGLADQPHVSHYRLAAHLGVAFTIFGLCLLFALQLGRRPPAVPAARRATLLPLVVFGVLLGVQVVWGAFVAGLKAGLYYPTFPLMGGAVVPPGFLALSPPLLNLLENPVTVQWVHRVLGVALLVGASVVWLRARGVRGDRVGARLGAGLLGATGLQGALGVLVLLSGVSLTFAVAHQVLALALLALWLLAIHRLRAAAPRPGT